MLRSRFRINYSKIVKELIDKMILTKSEIADKLGVSFASINRWENGTHSPTTSAKIRIIELCKKYNVKLEETNG